MDITKLTDSRGKVYGISIWFNKGNQNLTLRNWKPIRKQNKIDYPTDKDVNVRRKWGIRTNGAVKGEDTCLDWTLSLGHIELNFTDFEYGRFRK